MCSNPKLFSTAMCECTHNPKPMTGSESSSLIACVGTLNKFLTLIKYVKNKVLKKSKEHNDAQTAKSSSQVQHQAYRSYVEFLESKVQEAITTLIKIRSQKPTELFPIYALQSCLLHHLDVSADRTNHFITRAEEALDQPFMAHYAREAKTQLTVFYDSYREHAVDTHKAFAVHRSVSNSASSAPISDQPRDGYSFLAYESCVYCSNAASLHDPIDHHGDVATVALSLAEQLVQEPESSLWLEVSKAGSNILAYVRPETAGPVNVDGSDRGDARDDSDTKERLMAAVRITLDDPEEDELEDGIHGFRGVTSYFYTLPDGLARMEIRPEKLSSVLNSDIGNDDGFREVATAFATSLRQTAETLGDAFQSLNRSNELSEDERLTRVAFEEELRSVTELLSQLDPKGSVPASDFSERDIG